MNLCTWKHVVVQLGRVWWWCWWWWWWWWWW